MLSVNWGGFVGRRYQIIHCSNQATEEVKAFTSQDKEEPRGSQNSRELFDVEFELEGEVIDVGSKVDKEKQSDEKMGGKLKTVSAGPTTHSKKRVALVVMKGTIAARGIMIMQQELRLFFRVLLVFLQLELTHSL